MPDTLTELIKTLEIESKRLGRASDLAAVEMSLVDVLHHIRELNRLQSKRGAKPQSQYGEELGI
jgi:hypothetical protein